MMRIMLVMGVLMAIWLLFLMVVGVLVRMMLLVLNRIFNNLLCLLMHSEMAGLPMRYKERSKSSHHIANKEIV